MNHRKRRATEELLPLRAPKISRRTCIRDTGEQVEVGSLPERWWQIGELGLNLMKDTAVSLAKCMCCIIHYTWRGSLNLPLYSRVDLPGRSTQRYPSTTTPFTYTRTHTRT